MATLNTTFPVRDGDDLDYEHAVPGTVCDDKADGLDISLLSGFERESDRRDADLSPALFIERVPDGWAVHVYRFGGDDPVFIVRIPDADGEGGTSREPIVIDENDFRDHVELRRFCQ